MTGTLTNILKEHERALVQLAFLNDAASRIYLQGFNDDDMNVIRASMNYISCDFHRHCEDEERKVYPGLTGFVSVLSLQEFKEEHKKITRSLEGIKHLMAGVNGSLTDRDILFELKKSSREFSHLFSGHIHRENDCFFLMAKQILPPKTLTQIFKNWKQK